MVSFKKTSNSNALKLYRYKRYKYRKYFIKEEKTLRHRVYYYKCSIDGCNGKIKYFDNELKNAAFKCKFCRSKKEPYRHLYTQLRLECKRRKIKLLLSFRDFVSNFIGKNCFYCGSKLDWVIYSSAGHHGFGYHLDRKDNTKGYSKENCVTCCKTCNFTKGNRFTYGEFMILSEGLKKIIELRKNGTEFH